MLLSFQDFAKDRYGVSAMVQSQQKLGEYESYFCHRKPNSWTNAQSQLKTQKNNDDFMVSCSWRFAIEQINKTKTFALPWCDHKFNDHLYQFLCHEMVFGVLRVDEFS